ncbi:amino acid adenylation domain-containing protein [Streptomyces sp. NPDC052077]|uniref:amino acid adenylation domain-containing protein n=1 Tax=Streptomyces sp. NPDC052077 TaxID=3154757 RepID=UPI003432512B
MAAGTHHPHGDGSATPAGPPSAGDGAAAPGTEEDLPRRIREWNRTEREYPREATAHELFAETARRRPTAVALSPEGGDDLTYGQLLDRVDRVASALSARGVRPRDRVAVALERSVEGYVAILGVLRAGAVYVPLDLNSPTRLTESVVRDAGCRVTIVSRGDQRGPSGGVTQRVDIAGAMREPLRDVHPGVGAEDPAYVLYTSGSTGAPKGVVVPHRGIVRLVRGQPVIGFAPEDTVCSTVNLTFDLSVFDLFGALLNGARLVVPTQATLLSAVALEGLLVRERISVMWLGAALFHQLARLRPQMFGTLRCLVVGGDVVSPAAVRGVLEHGAPGRLVDGYGPTENAVLSTAHVIDGVPPEGEPVPIGRPLSNCTAYVVREDGSLADVSEEGELWVGGDGVAIGYLGQPGLTAERFVPDPFGARRGARLYRTGDMARWRTDGVIEFLGRRDRQTKIGGFRVDLRGIETVLAAHPQVREAAVAVVEEGGAERLRGWAVAEETADPRTLPALLWTYLRDRLPVFMVPQDIVLVEAMPVDARGKVDRAALTASRGAMAAAAVPREEQPLGRAERAVAEVWRRVLGAPVGRSDNFFDLGGQSLQTTQVAAAVAARLGIPAGRESQVIRSLLRNPTAVAFAEDLRALAPGRTDAAPVDFASEAALPPAVGFGAPPVDAPRDPRRVLLTGATGFLGVFLLDRLVASGTGKVYCLVRADDAAHVLRRLAGRARRYGLDPEAVHDHVVPVPGDLSRPLLGLGPDAFDTLARSVDAIVHSGSLVNFAYPYTTLRTTNVDGVRTLLDLASRHRLKPFHHVSTMISLVGLGTAGERYVMEDRPPAFPERITLGYAESKWVAEELVRRAAGAGLPVSLYRPYEITGTRDRGIWNTDTLMCALFRTIAETGLAPDVGLPLDFVPVDYTAEAIVHILRNEEPDGRVYHLTNPRDARLGLLVERLRALGYPVREVPYGEWTDAVTRLTRRDPRHPMTAFMPMFHDGAAGADITVKEMYFAETFPEFSRYNTERSTRGAGLVLPPVDAELIDLYLRYFLDSGFLTAPTTAPRATAPATPAHAPRPPFINGAPRIPAERTPDTSRRLVKDLLPHVAGHLRANALRPALLRGAVTMEQIRRLIVSELHAQPAEAASFDRLASRFPAGAPGRLFRDAARSLHLVRGPLEAAAASLGLPVTGADDRPVPSGARELADFHSDLARTASVGAAAVVLRNELVLWPAVCAELVHGLSVSRTPVPDPVRAYLVPFVQPATGLRAAATRLAEDVVGAGESAAAPVRAAERLDHVLTSYWRTVAAL